MNNALLAVLSQLEKERGISRKSLIEAIEFALQSAAQSAARKSVGTANDVRVTIDPRTCDILTYGTLVVSDDVKGPDYISVDAARKIKPDANPGDTVEVQIFPKDFGRIAAQAAKQAITQKIHEAERNLLYDTYKDRIGDILTGTVKAVQHGEYIVDVGHAEAVIPKKERVTAENFQVGETIRAYLVDVKRDASGGPGIILSRAAREFVKALFCLEVSEIADGTVEVMGVSRDPGFRTKIAVRSLDGKIDPVGACVGQRGARVKNIIDELNGEKIDIVTWDENILVYAKNALAPAVVQDIVIDNENFRLLHVYVDPDQYSLAIGRRGQNAKLTAQLLGYTIDVRKTVSEEPFEAKKRMTIEELASIDGIGHEIAEIIVEHGFLSLDGIIAQSQADFCEASSLDPDVAERVWNTAKEMARRQDSAVNTSTTD